MKMDITQSRLRFNYISESFFNDFFKMADQADLVSANITSGVRRNDTQYISLLGATLRTQCT